MRSRPAGILSVLGFLAIGVYYLVLALLPKDITLPSPEYYVNDYANVFSSASKDYYLSKSEEVFSKTEGSEIGGLQIVVATYQINDSSDIDGRYNKTDLFRKWKIGENDMGLLFVYYYQSDSEGKTVLKKISTEIGYRLTSFLTATAMGNILDADFADDKDEEIAQAHAYGDVLSHVLPEAYGISVTPFDEERFQDYEIHYAGPAYAPSEPVDYLTYVFQEGGFWDQFGIPALILGLVVLGDGFVFASGAGGSSGGAGVSRWRHS
jgi:hypothetical protein